MKQPGAGDYVTIKDTLVNKYPSHFTKNKAYRVSRSNKYSFDIRDNTGPINLALKFIKDIIKIVEKDWVEVEL